MKVYIPQELESYGPIFSTMEKALDWCVANNSAGIYVHEIDNDSEFDSARGEAADIESISVCEHRGHVLKVRPENHPPFRRVSCDRCGHYWDEEKNLPDWEDVISKAEPCIFSVPVLQEGAVSTGSHD